MIPSYVTARNEQAIRAGLIIARQVLRGNRLTTWYDGSEASWRATSWCHRAKPFNQRIGGTMSSHEFRCLSPCSGWPTYEHFTLHTIGPDLYRGKCVNEQMPDSEDDIGDDITAYIVEGAMTVYVGPVAAMISRQLVPGDVESKAKSYGSEGDFWDCFPLPDSRVIVVDHIGRRQCHREEQAEKSRRDFKTTGELLSTWARHVDVWAVACMEDYRNVETKDRRRFVVSSESLDAIREATDELLDAIRCANVRVMDRAGPNKDEVAAAQSDSAFLDFMAKAGIRKAGPRVNR